VFGFPVTDVYVCSSGSVKCITAEIRLFDFLSEVDDVMNFGPYVVNETYK
jgi:hypothetical protein